MHNNFRLPPTHTHARTHTHNFSFFLLFLYQWPDYLVPFVRFGRQCTEEIFPVLAIKPVLLSFFVSPGSLTWVFLFLFFHMPFVCGRIISRAFNLSFFSTDCSIVKGNQLLRKFNFILIDTQIGFMIQFCSYYYKQNWLKEKNQSLKN